MTTDSTSPYEAPQLVEIGSILNVTQGYAHASGQDGFNFFGFEIPLPGGSNPHS